MATTFAELFGAVFPAEADTADGVVFGPTGVDYTGTATFGGGGTGDATLAKQEEILAAIGNVPTADSDEIATAVAAKLTGLKLTIAQQRSIAGSKELYVYQGDDYREDPTRIEIDQSGLSNPSADLSSYHLVVSFQQTESTIGIRMEIEGDAGEHYALFDPSAALTETFEAGRFEALFRIEYAANEYKTVCPGFVIVETHDVEPGDIIDI